MAGNNKPPTSLDTFEEAFTDFLFRQGVVGLGYGKARALIEHFGTLDNLRDATWPLLALVKSVSIPVAQSLDYRLQRLNSNALARYERLVDQFKPTRTDVSHEIWKQVGTAHILKHSIRIFSGPTTARLNENTPRLLDFLELQEKILQLDLGTSSTLTRREHQLLKDFHLVPENVRMLERLQGFLRKHGR